jgi:hypothetical protein
VSTALAADGWSELAPSGEPMTDDFTDVLTYLRPLF